MLAYLCINSLKGTVSWDFWPPFFHDSNPSENIIHMQTCFCICSRFYNRDICMCKTIRVIGIKLRGINWPHGVKLSYVYDTAHTRTLGVPTLELKISSFWKSWLPTVRFHFLLLGLKYSNFRFRYISKIKDIFKNTHINPSVSLEKKSRDTVPLAIKKNTTQNQIWFFLNKVFSDGHIKNKTIKNVMSWHLFRKNQQ